jgi:hypothetical protein
MTSKNLIRLPIEDGHSGVKCFILLGILGVSLVRL